MSHETEPLVIDIPDALRGLSCWFNWRWATQPDGKKFKMPVQPTGKPASSTGKETWHEYERAARAAHNFEGLAIGLGRIDDATHVWGIDLDGAMVDGGGLKDWAVEILARVDSYAEYSPSGKGIHILVLGDAEMLPAVKLNLTETEHVEFYSHSRYFTFSGNHVPGTPDDLQPREAVYKALLAEYEALRPSPVRSRSARSAEKPATGGKADKRSPSLTDEEVVKLAQSSPSGAAFTRLWEGELGDYKNDHSLADMALAGRLAFWTGKDPEQMDSLFRKSGLMRPKWDTRRGLSTYGEQTIEIAIDNADEVYTGGDKASESFLDNLKRRRAEKIAKTQTVGENLKLGSVQDHHRGDDKPAHGAKREVGKAVVDKNRAALDAIPERSPMTGRIMSRTDGAMVTGPGGVGMVPLVPAGTVQDDLFHVNGVAPIPEPGIVDAPLTLPESAIFTEPVKKAQSVNQARPVPASESVAEHIETRPQEVAPPDSEAATEPPAIDVQPNEVGTPAEAKYPDPDDIGNADRLVTRYTGKLLWSPGTGWMYWDSRRWAIGDQYAHLAGQETARSIMQEAVDPRLDPEKQKALFSHYHKSAALGARNAMITTATVRPQFFIEQKHLDAQDMFFNVLNGTLNLETGGLMQHDPEMRITKLAPVRWNPDARSALWEEFLERATIGQEGLAEFLQRAVGYTLTGLTLDDVFFVVKGNAGTGKTTFTMAIRNMMGDYATTMRSEVITDKLGGAGGGGHQEEIAVLAGRRLVLSSETNASDSIKEGLVKGLTGKEEIGASRKYGHQMWFRPQFKLWLAANDMPKMRSDDTGMWRRIHKLTFEHKFSPADPRVREALLNDPHHREAILAWAVRGTHEWKRHGLKPPQSVVDATETLRQSTDRLADFFEDVCYFNPNAGLWVSSADLANAYWKWAVDNNVPERFRPSLRGDTFKNALAHRGASPKKSGGQRGWTGLILKDESEQD